jgi:hypothetical protein
MVVGRQQRAVGTLALIDLGAGVHGHLGAIYEPIMQLVL